MRLLILLGLVYLGYRALKSWTLQSPTQNSTFENTGGDIDNLMVKDPFCEVYFPKKEGVHLEVDGEVLSFCSEGCRDGFLASRRNTS